MSDYDVQLNAEKELRFFFVRACVEHVTDQSPASEYNRFWFWINSLLKGDGGRICEQQREGRRGKIKRKDIRERERNRFEFEKDGDIKTEVKKRKREYGCVSIQSLETLCYFFMAAKRSAFSLHFGTSWLPSAFLKMHLMTHEVWVGPFNEPLGPGHLVRLAQN